MYKPKKITALLLSFVMIFSLAISPLSVVYASELPQLPKVEPSKEIKPSTTPSDTKSTITPPAPKITPTLPSKTTPVVPVKTVEQPARAQGVNYEVKENVKRIPAGSKIMPRDNTSREQAVLLMVSVYEMFAGKN